MHTVNHISYDVVCSTDEEVGISVLLEDLPIVAAGGADDCLLKLDTIII